MEKQKTLQILKNILIPFIITTLIWLVSLLILKNLGTLVKLFNKSEMVISYFKSLSKKELTFPIPVFCSIFIINVILFMLIKKKNALFIVLIILLNLLFIIPSIMFTTIGNDFVFQLVEELQNYIK